MKPPQNLQTTRTRGPLVHHVRAFLIPAEPYRPAPQKREMTPETAAIVNAALQRRHRAAMVKNRIDYASSIRLERAGMGLARITAAVERAARAESPTAREKRIDEEMKRWREERRIQEGPLTLADRERLARYLAPQLAGGLREARALVGVGR